MTRGNAFFFVIAGAVLFLSGPAGAQPPVPSTGTAPSIISDEPFVVEAAKRLALPLDELSSLRRKGFGKTELLSFAAIGKASPKPWKDLVKEREGGRALRDLAKDAGLDYNVVFQASDKLRREIEVSTGKRPVAP